MSQKRTLDSFFAPKNKRLRDEEQIPDILVSSFGRRPSFVYQNPEFPQSLCVEIPSLPTKIGTEMNNQPDLDIIYFEPYIPRHIARTIFEFLRSELPFYRVEYKIKRGDIETEIRTPRWTTVFGLDDTSTFDSDGWPVDVISGKRVNDRRYNKYHPRPIPDCLDRLRCSTEAAVNCKFNFCLVNYYASGADSISYHSDDERFLGPDPAIASFSFGAQRDFMLKHKASPTQASRASHAKGLKLPLRSGDMVLMRGKTQSNWLHSIPKRTGKNLNDGGRVNITFRRAVSKDGTENYYNYNVGTGPVYKWDSVLQEMKLWQSEEKEIMN